MGEGANPSAVLKWQAVILQGTVVLMAPKLMKKENLRTPIEFDPWELILYFEGISFTDGRVKSKDKEAVGV